MSDTTAFDLLNSMRDEALALADQGINYTSQAAGVKNIAYVVNDIYFFSDAQTIREVSVCENLMAVPQTKHWLRGLINSKGTLYSVSDLSLFAGFEKPISTKQGHLLLLDDHFSQCALLVSRVIGFRYFEESTPISDMNARQNLLDGLSPFVDQGFKSEGQDWYHLNVNKMLGAEQFLEVQ